MGEKKVLGIGNALTDILVEVSDERLEEFGLPKGSMQLVDAERSRTLMAELGEVCTERRCAGGCASNTITGLGELGVATAFIGKVGRDPVGAFFEKDLVSHGVESRLLRSDSPSGTALSLVTPDGERTFATHLGAAVELGAGELTPDLFQGAGRFHIEGYLVQNHELIAGAVQRAKQAGLTVSIDLAAYNVVAENLQFLRGLVGQGLDVVFANEDEAQAFTGLDDMEAALEILAGQCEVAVLKLGAKGALLARGAERARIEIEALEPLDTTGAGDLYAAGFLYGLVRDLPLAACGRAGALVAREIIQVMGTKLPAPTWDRLRGQIAAL